MGERLESLLRYVVKVEPLASAVPADLAAWFGTTLQRYFTDPAVTAADDGQTELR